MKKIVIVTGIAIALAASPSFAKGKEKGGDRRETKADKHEAKRGKDDKDNKDKKFKDRKQHGHERAHDSRPAGWDKGKKTGWKDCDVPPGQAKKAGCGSDHPRSTRAAHPRMPIHGREAKTPRHERPAPGATTTTAAKGHDPFEPARRRKQSGETPKSSTK